MGINSEKKNRKKKKKKKEKKGNKFRIETKTNVMKNYRRPSPECSPCMNDCERCRDVATPLCAVAPAVGAAGNVVGEETDAAGGRDWPAIAPPPRPPGPGRGVA